MSWWRFRNDRKYLFSCIYNPPITISPTSLFSANFNGNHVKNHPQPWTCPLILLSPWTIFLSDFAAESFFVCVNQVKATYVFSWSENKGVERKWISHQSALKYNCRNWHLNQPALWTGMWLDKQSFLHSESCWSGFIDALNDHQLSQLLWKYVCLKMTHWSLICVKIQICA